MPGIASAANQRNRIRMRENLVKVFRREFGRLSAREIAIVRFARKSGYGKGFQAAARWFRKVA